MSYCRWSEGHVYLFPTQDAICCCSCLLAPGDANGIWHDDTYLPDKQAALAHLQAHVDAGHSVPEEAFARLLAEITEQEG